MTISCLIFYIFSPFKVNWRTSESFLYGNFLTFTQFRFLLPISTMKIGFPVNWFIIFFDMLFHHILLIGLLVQFYPSIWHKHCCIKVLKFWKDWVNYIIVFWKNRVCFVPRNQFLQVIEKDIFILIEDICLY